MDIYESIVELKRAGEPFVIATVTRSLGSTPREAGAKMIIKKDGGILGTIGGGAVEKLICDEAQKVLSSQQPVTFDYDLGQLKMQCGGKMSIFLEPVIPSPQLIVFGAGHIGLALSKLADLLGFRLTVVDNRPEFANKERFPNATQIVAKEYKDSLDQLQFTDDACIVIVTHRHIHDEIVLEHCVQQPFRYLGMIGSRTKVKKALIRLEENGIAKEKIQRIHTPIGLNIGAQTPEEIAVAIVAEIIAVRRGANLGNMSMRLEND